jgi:hypothetical protein
LCPSQRSLLSLLVYLIAVTTASAAVEFEDSFEGDKRAAWGLFQRFTIVNDGSDNQALAGDGQAAFGDLAWRDYCVQARVRFRQPHRSNGSAEYAILTGRYEPDLKTGYRLILDTLHGLRLVPPRANHPHLTAVRPEALNLYDRYNDIRLTFRGALVQAHCNEELVAETFAPWPDRGGVLIGSACSNRSAGAEIFWDGISATDSVAPAYLHRIEIAPGFQPRVGVNRVRVTLRNISDRPKTLSAHSQAKGVSGRESNSSSAPVLLESGKESTVDVPIVAREPGDLKVSIFIRDQHGQTLNAPTGAHAVFNVKPFVELHPVESVFYTDEQALVRLGMNDDPASTAEDRSFRVTLRRINEDAPLAQWRVPVKGPNTDFEVPWAGVITPGNYYRLSAQLVAAASESISISSAVVGVFPRPEPIVLPAVTRVRIREDGATLVNDRPFLPLYLIHGSTSWLKGTRLNSDAIEQHMREIKARGFTVADGDDIDHHWERHNLYSISRAVGPGQKRSGPGPNPFDLNAVRARARELREHPGWLGGGLRDEPDLAFQYGYGTPALFNEAAAALKAELPNRLFHSELSHGGLKWFGQMNGIEAFIIGFQSDPALVAERTRRSVQLAQRARRPASPWTSILVMPYDDPGFTQPTPMAGQIRCASYAALTQGAKGLEFYGYHQGTFIQDRAPSAWSGFKGLNQELHRLSGAILSAEPPQKITAIDSPSGVHLLQRLHEGRVYLWAVNVSETASIPVRFQLPESLASSERVRVLFEDRSVVVKDGQFRDTLGGWDAHVYELTPP